MYYHDYMQGKISLVNNHTLKWYKFVGDPIMYEGKECVIIRDPQYTVILPLLDLIDIDGAVRYLDFDEFEASGATTNEFTYAEKSVLLFLTLKQYQLAGEDGWFRINYDDIIAEVAGVEKGDLKQIIDAFVTYGVLAVNRDAVFSNGKALPYAYHFYYARGKMPYSGVEDLFKKPLHSHNPYSPFTPIKRI